MTEPINLRDPVLEICRRLGITHNLTARIDIHPTHVTAETYTPNAKGRPHINPETGEPAIETQTFETSAT